MSRQRHETRDCSWQPVNKHVTTWEQHKTPSSPWDCHSGSFLTRSQTAADVFCDSALSSSITVQRSKTTAQVNIALTKFETALQVSVLIWVLVLWDGVAKRLLTLYLDWFWNLSVFMSRYLSVCHIVVSACLSVRLSALYLSVCVCLAVRVCLSTCLSLTACLSHCCLSVRLCVGLSLYLSVSLAVCISACLPACLPVSLPICLSAHLPVCLSVSLCLFVSLNIDHLQNIWDRVL